MALDVSSSQRTLKGSTQLVAQAMAAGSNIEVVWGNHATAFISGSASTNRKKIFLPNMPADDDNAKILTWGYLTHEIAHENFTDFGPQRPKHPAMRQVYQVLEDVRIEIKSSARYPGSAINLKRLVKHFIDANQFLPFDPEMSAPNTLVGYIAHTLRADFLGQATEEQSKLFKSHIQTLIPKGAYIKLNSLMYKVKDCPDTQAVINLAEDIFSMLEEEQQKEEEQNQDQNQDQNSGDGQSSPQDSQDDSDESQDSSQESQSSDDDSDDSQDQNSQSNSGSSDDESDSSDEAPADSADDSDQSKSSGGLKSMLDENADVDEADLGELVAKDINQLASDNPYESLSPMTKQTIPLGVDSTVLSEVRQASNATKQRILSLLEAQAISKVVHKSSGSRINSNRVTRIISGDLNIFQKKILGQTQNTAVQILIDISGSMSGGNDSLATKAGLSVSLALEQAKGVNCAVTAFPFGNSVLELTSFSERTSGTSKRYDKAKANGGTPMSEAILTVAYDLLNQPNDRKLLLVITDGLPNNSNSCEQVIHSIQDMGIEVLGLGINAQLPTFFSVAQSINTIDQLPKAMFDMLKEQLSKAA